MRNKIAVISIALLFLGFVRVDGQDTIKYNIHQIDTFRLTDKRFKQTVAYTYRTAIFYIDYNDFKKVLEDKLKRNDYRREIYEEEWNKLIADIRTSDTVYLTQKTFHEADIIPFDDFLIGQIEDNKCVIRDKDSNLQRVIIRKTFSNFYNPGIWTGRLYFLGSSKDHFIEATDIIS